MLDYNYEIPDCIIAAIRYVNLLYPTNEDGMWAGILADWLEDHRDELLVGASGPTDPAQRLDALIAHLRSRFEGR